MKKYLLGLFAIALAIGFSAFNTKSHTAKSTTGKVFTDYWYTYTGPNQTVAERKKKTNYTSPSTTEPASCVGTGNECAVQVSGITGTPPANISSLSVSFNAITGFPESGSNFLANDEKN